MTAARDDEAATRDSELAAGLKRLLEPMTLALMAAQGLLCITLLSAVLNRTGDFVFPPEIAIRAWMSCSASFVMIFVAYMMLFFSNIFILYYKFRSFLHNFLLMISMLLSTFAVCITIFEIVQLSDATVKAMLDMRNHPKAPKDKL